MMYCTYSTQVDHLTYCKKSTLATAHHEQLTTWYNTYSKLNWLLTKVHDHSVT